jgi:hypothetical protein
MNGCPRFAARKGHERMAHRASRPFVDHFHEAKSKLGVAAFTERIRAMLALQGVHLVGNADQHRPPLSIVSISLDVS